MSDTPKSGSPRRPRTRKPISFQILLVILCLTIALPTVIAATFFAVQYVNTSRHEEETERTRATENQERALIHQAELLRRALDNELTNMENMLNTLAKSSVLLTGDLEGFDGYAKRIVNPTEAVIALRRRDGQHITNTLFPFGSAGLPKFPGSRDKTLYEQRRTVYSDLVKGDAFGGPLVVVSIPVEVQGELMGLSFAVSPAKIREVMQRQLLKDSQVGIVADQKSIIIARSVKHGDNVGRKLTDSYDESWGGGVRRFENSEGVSLVAAYARSPLSGWVAAVAEKPVTVAVTPDTVLSRVVLIVIVLLGSVGIALFIGRRVVANYDRVVRELYHREGNRMQVILYIISSTATAMGVAREYVEVVRGRLLAINHGFSALAHHELEGASLRELLNQELHAYKDNIQIGSDTDVELPTQHVTNVSLLIHELATNAVKHGALRSPDTGMVTVRWEHRDRCLCLWWSESGGPEVTSPTRRGQGSQLITRILSDMGGKVTPQYNKEGFRCTIEIPLP